MTACIATVTLVVPDYDEAIRFYCEALGFELLEDTVLPDGKRWVRVAPGPSGAALLLARADTGEQRMAVGNQTGGRVSFFLQTDDFDRNCARYAGAGVLFLEDPRQETYGKVAVFRDPFGNKWDLIQPA